MYFVNNCARVHACVAPTQTLCTLPAAGGLPRAPMQPVPPPQSSHRCSCDQHLNLSLPVCALYMNGGPEFTAKWQPEDILGMRWGRGVMPSSPGTCG